MAPLTIGFADEADAEEWDAFLAGCPEALVYHTWAYGSLLCDVLACARRYLVVRRDGCISGVLPVMEREGPWGRVRNSLPFFGSTGSIVATDEDSARILCGGWAELATETGVAAATVVENPLREWAGAALQHDVTDARIGQWTGLPSGPGGWARLLGCFEGAARRNLRKADAAGVRVVEEPEALGRLAELHRENMGAIGGRSKPDVFFERLPERLVCGRDYRVFAARVDGAVVAALLVLEFGSTVEYFIPAVDAEFRSVEPTAAILRSAMQAAIARGLRAWNWGGTWLSQKGVYRFKRKWGATDRPYSYRIQLNEPRLREASPDALAKAYPGFYVVPYGILSVADG